MRFNWSRIGRWLALVSSGAVVFQTATGCDLALQFIQTGLLGAIGGMLYFLSRNV
jgi:hypothetical protein